VRRTKRPSIWLAASPVEMSVSAMVGVWNDTTGPCTTSTCENTASQNPRIAGARACSAFT